MNTNTIKTIVLAFVAMSACGVEDTGLEATPTSPGGKLDTPGDLIGEALPEYNDLLPFPQGDFEADTLAGWDTERLVGSHSAQISTSLAAHGERSALFEVRPVDETPKFGGWRAELKDPFRPYLGQEIWYRLSFRIPGTYPTDTGDAMVIAQWHQLPHRSPPLAFRYKTYEGSAPKLEITTQVGPIEVPDPLPPDDDGTWKSGDKIKLYKEKRPEKDVWHTFAIHVRWSPDPHAGFIRIWRVRGDDDQDPEQIVDYKGTVGFDPTLFDASEFGDFSDRFPYLFDKGSSFKLGLYSYKQTADNTTYTIHHDDYRRGATASEIGLAQLQPGD